MAKVLEYRCYRQFLSDFLEERRLSYREFAKNYSEYVSFPFLSKLLRRNSSGQFLREVNIRPEKLSALLKAMGLQPEEISHLVLCRLQNDHQTGEYRHSSTFGVILESLRSTAQGKDSVASRILEALELLSVTRRQKVLKELKHQLSVEWNRSTSELKCQRLQTLAKEIS